MLLFFPRFIPEKIENLANGLHQSPVVKRSQLALYGLLCQLRSFNHGSFRASPFAKFSIFFSILCTACAQPCHQWKLASIKAYCPSTTYVKLSLSPSNDFNGLGTELMCSNGIMQLYFNSVTLLLPPNEGDEQHAKVLLGIGDEQHEFIAIRMLGGQKVMMPDIAVQLIIASLLDGREIEVSIGRYQSTLIPEGFSKLYDNLLSTF